MRRSRRLLQASEAEGRSAGRCGRRREADVWLEAPFESSFVFVWQVKEAVAAFEKQISKENDMS